MVSRRNPWSPDPNPLGARIWTTPLGGFGRASISQVTTRRDVVAARVRKEGRSLPADEEMFPLYAQMYFDQADVGSVNRAFKYLGILVDVAHFHYDYATSERGRLVAAFLLRAPKSLYDLSEEWKVLGLTDTWLPSVGWQWRAPFPAPVGEKGECDRLLERFSFPEDTSRAAAHDVLHEGFVSLRDSAKYPMRVCPQVGFARLWENLTTPLHEDGYDGRFTQVRVACWPSLYHAPLDGFDATTRDLKVRLLIQTGDPDEASLTTEAVLAN